MSPTRFSEEVIRQSGYPISSECTRLRGAVDPKGTQFCTIQKGYQAVDTLAVVKGL